MKNEIKTTQLKVFIQDAKVLSKDEQRTLPEEKLKSTEAKTGIWIEVTCPEGACSIEGDKITLPAGGVIPKESKGIWLSLFCPENQCAIEGSADLP